MYKKYVKHVQSKTPHHRRQHAVQFAGLFTALAFVVWITTLGWRFGPQQGANNATVSSADQGMLAGAAASQTQLPADTGLEVVNDGSTTSRFSNY